MSRPRTYKKRYEAALREIQYLRGIIYSVPAYIECMCGRNGAGDEHTATCLKAFVRRCLQEALKRGKP